VPTSSIAMVTTTTTESIISESSETVISTPIEVFCKEKDYSRVNCNTW